MNYRDNGTWSIAENGGSGNLVGIKTDKSDWLIAEEVNLGDALAICYHHNMKNLKDSLKIKDSKTYSLIRCTFSSCAMNISGLFCIHNNETCHRRTV